MASLLNRIYASVRPLIKAAGQQTVLVRNQASPTLHHPNQVYASTKTTPYELIDEKEPDKVAKEIIDKVNTQVTSPVLSRLFAVVHLAGKQFKITDGDIIVVEGYWPPDCGDKISLDKVMVLGASNFTLVGQPLIQKGLVQVEASVIEKTISHTKTHFRKKRRKQYMRINFYRIPQTYLRINSIKIVGEVNNPPEVRGLDNIVF